MDLDSVTTASEGLHARKPAWFAAGASCLVDIGQQKHCLVLDQVVQQFA